MSPENLKLTEVMVQNERRSAGSRFSQLAFIFQQVEISKTTQMS